MSDIHEPSPHVAPFILETLTSKALHFSICEIQSRMRLDDPEALDLDYTRLMMGFLLFKPEPRRLAMIGLGGGSLAKFCFRHLPGARIEVVEINPDVIALRDEFHVPRDCARFKVLLADGARFVREPPHPVDVLIVDGFDDQGQPPRLASQRFYDDCRDTLAADGMMIVNLHSGHRRHAFHVERICRSFDGQALFVRSPDDGNTVAFAFRNATPHAGRAVALHRPARLKERAAVSLEPAFASIDRALQEMQA